MTPPRLTVAICFHDDEPHLAAAIRSVLVQTERDFELFLVDDGSQDRSVAVARTFLPDPRVRIFSDGRRRRLGARLNEAIANARAPLFARMDGDDVSHPSRFARQIALLSSDERLDAVGSWAALVDESEVPFGVIEVSKRAPSPRSLLDRGLVPHATMLARTQWLRSYRYDEELPRAEDRDLWCRAGLSSRVGVVDNVLYAIRVLADAASFLPDYLSGQRDLRRVIMRYGPRFIGVPSTAALIANSIAKASAMHVGHRLGQAKRIVRRRGRKPTSDERELVREAFEAARQAP